MKKSRQPKRPKKSSIQKLSKCPKVSLPLTNEARSHEQQLDLQTKVNQTELFVWLKNRANLEFSSQAHNQNKHLLYSILNLLQINRLQNSSRVKDKYSMMKGLLVENTRVVLILAYRFFYLLIFAFNLMSCCGETAQGRRIWANSTYNTRLVAASTASKNTHINHVNYIKVHLECDRDWRLGKETGRSTSSWCSLLAERRTKRLAE